MVIPDVSIFVSNEKIQVAGIELTDGPLRVGETIHIHGHTSDFCQTVDAIQIEHDNVQEAGVGAEIGIKVAQHARENDDVLVVTED